MGKLSPSIVIGLGETGTEIARELAGLIASSGDTDIAQLTRSFALTAGGLRPVHLDGSPAGADAVEIAGLETAAEPGVWAANYQALVEHSAPLQRSIEKAVTEVRNFSRAMQAERRARALSDHLSVYVVSSLAEPVGSAALIPVLAMLRETFRSTFSGLLARVQLVLLAHDLLPAAFRASPLLKARSFACIQELELAFEGTRLLPHQLSAEFVWLLSRRNEEDLFVGDYFQLIPVIAHQMLTLLRGEVFQDTSFRGGVETHLEGKALRYSTFGFSKVVFPRDRIFAHACDVLVARTLVGLPVLAPRTLEAGSVYAMVKGFIHEQKIDRILESLGKHVDGSDIWVRYAPGSAILEDEDAERLVHRLEEYDDDYERQHSTAMQGAVSDKRSHLVAEQRAAILARLGALLDNLEPGGLAVGEAWLSALLDDVQQVEWIHGDVSVSPVTLLVVDRDLDRYYEPKIFGDDRNPEAEEYVTRHPSAAGGRRQLLRVLRQDLAEKKRALAEAVAASAQRQAELGKVEAAVEALAGTKEGRASADAAAETAPPAEDPREVASLLNREFELRVEEENENTYLTGLAEEIAQLEPLFARVHAEVSRLDHTVQSASERRRIFRPIHEQNLDAVTKAAERLGEGARLYRSRRAAAEEAAERRNLWVALRLLLALAVVALFTVGWLALDQLRRVPAWGYALAAVFAAAGLAWSYWIQVGKPLADAREAAHAARRQRDNARDSLVAARRTVRETVYEDHRHGSLVDWRTDLTQLVRSLRTQVQALRAALIRQGESAEASSFVVPDNPFLEWLLPPGGVAMLLDGRAGEIDLELREMWQKTSPSRVFEEFRSARNGDGLAPLMSRITGCARHVLRDLLERSVESFFVDVVPSEPDRLNRLNRLYRNAAPFAKRLVELGGVTGESLVAVGLAEPKEKSPVRRSLKTIVPGDGYYESEVKTEVSILRLVIGFPAFQFAPMEEARVSLNQLDAATRARLYVEPDWVAEVEDLQPKVYRLGLADDPFRRLACLTLAYGLVEQGGGDGVTRPIRHGAREHPGYEAFVRHLGTLAGSRDRLALGRALEQVRRNGAAEPGPVERLRAYLEAEADLDEVDREIVEREMDALSGRQY